MPEVVTGDGSCRVQSPDGTGDNCAYPMMTSTDECSDKVFIGGIGVVCEGHRVAPHNKRGCVPDTSVVTEFSNKVFIGGKGVAVVGSKYGDNVIVSGNSKVTIG